MKKKARIILVFCTVSKIMLAQSKKGLERGPADGGSSYERDLCHADPSDSRTFAILTIRFLSLFLTCKKIPQSEGGGGEGEGV